MSDKHSPSILTFPRRTRRLHNLVQSPAITQAISPQSFLYSASTSTELKTTALKILRIKSLSNILHADPATTLPIDQTTPTPTAIFMCSKIRSRPNKSQGKNDRLSAEGKSSKRVKCEQNSPSMPTSATISSHQDLLPFCKLSASQQPNSVSSVHSKIRTLLDLEEIYVSLQKTAPLNPTFGCFVATISSATKENKNAIRTGQKYSPLTGDQSHEAPKKSSERHLIEIVSNDNKKVEVEVHPVLLKAHTSQVTVDPKKHFLIDIPNPFLLSCRNRHLSSTSFLTDYKSGYAPIQLQQRNKEDEHRNDYESHANRSHFIKKKQQSTLNLPRTCGVSYIKPSQSIQSGNFEPLPPLIFQCSTSCSDTNQVLLEYSQEVQSFLERVCNDWLPFVLTDEDQMRQLLLGKQTGEVGWTKGINSLWPLLSESVFLLLPYSQTPLLDEKSVWASLQKCPFKIGILCKKSISGRKSYLKSLNIEGLTEHLTENKSEANKMQEQKSVTVCSSGDATIQHTNNNEECKSKQAPQLLSLLQQCGEERSIVTLSLRMQLYVEQSDWKSMPKQAKERLNRFILALKERLEKTSHKLTEDRLRVSKDFNDLKELKVALLNLRKGQKDEKASNYSWQDILRLNKSNNRLDRQFKMPLYYISTRDSFAFDLVERHTTLFRGGRPYTKVEYFFEADNLPTNYGDYLGITSYHGFFTQEELQKVENSTFAIEQTAFKNKFLQMTVQPTITNSKIKRTKFFFGYRYMWTRCQLAEPGSYIAAGVRRDVTRPPLFTKELEEWMVNGGIIEKDFINSVAINVYHDGKEGLAQHFDDAVRFKQPIYTIRLFSDARLSFGSQFYGFCNGAFIIPLPRGCICVMEENSYAANGVKHCVRPCDMTGKSAAVILRQMHHQVVSEAANYDQLVDFPAWVSTLSSHPKGVSYAEQKRREAEYLLIHQ